MRSLPIVIVDTQLDFSDSENGIELDSTETSANEADSTGSADSTRIEALIRSPNANVRDRSEEMLGEPAPPTTETAEASNPTNDGSGANGLVNSESDGSINSGTWPMSTTAPAGPSTSSDLSASSTPTSMSNTTSSISSSTPSSILSTSTSTSIITTTPTQSSTETATSGFGTQSNGTTKTKRIAIAVPISVVGLAIILAIVFFLLRRRRRDRMSLPPPYHAATSQTTAVSTQELMSSKPAETRSIPSMNVPMPLVSPTLPRSSTGGLSHHTAPDGHASQAELGTAIAVPVTRRQSVVEERAGSRQLARMPFEDFEDDEVGVGPVVPVVPVAPVRARPDDDAVSDVSDTERTERGRDFDEVSELSFHEVSPISPSSPEQRRFR